MTTATLVKNDPVALKEQVRRSLPTISLEQIRIASPCTVSWASMEGDERSRHCGQCDKTVHDLSKMTRAQGEALVNGGGKVCVRLWVRRDGTVLTQDCPVGLAKVRRHLARIGAIFGALLGWVVGLSGCAREEVFMGGPAVSPPPTSPQTTTTATTASTTSEATTSASPASPIEEEPTMMMGDVCEPSPPTSSSTTTSTTTGSR